MTRIRKKIYLLINLVISVFLCSCNGENDTFSSPRYDAFLEDIEDSIPFEQVVESYEYIKLEKNDRCIIGDIDQLIVKDTLLYVLSNGIHCFNLDGSHNFSINKKGHASSEFTHIKTMSVMENIICAFDDVQNKLIYYDGETGEYIRKLQLPERFPLVFGFGDKIIVDRRSFPCEDAANDERFLVYDIDNLKKPYKLFINDLESKKVAHGTLTADDDGLLFSSIVNNTVWKITPSTLTEYFRINVPEKYSLSTSQKQSLINGEQEDVKGKLFYLSFVNENPKFIIGRLILNEDYVFIVYDKKEDSMIAFKEISNLKKWKNPPLDIIASDNNAFYAAILPEDISLIKDISDSIEIPSTQQDTIAYNTWCSVTNEDNPIIVKYKLKTIKKNE